jgi:hypothetical protein
MGKTFLGTSVIWLYLQCFFVCCPRTVYITSARKCLTKLNAQARIERGGDRSELERGAIVAVTNFLCDDIFATDDAKQQATNLEVINVR